MRIVFRPQRRDGELTISKAGDVLTINGEDFDFTSVPDGASISYGEVPCDWIAGPVERISGELHIAVVLPHGPDPSAAIAFPEPITVTADGRITIPQRG